MARRHGGHGFGTARHCAGSTMIGHAGASLHRPLSVFLLEDILHLHQVGCVGGALGFESYLCVGLVAAKFNRGDFDIHTVDANAGAPGEVFDEGFLHSGFVLDRRLGAAHNRKYKCGDEKKLLWHSPIINGGSPYNERMKFGLIWVLAASLYGGELDGLLLRLAEEAEAFGRSAMKVVGQEDLELVAAEPPPRFIRRGSAPPQPKYRTRHLVSEYGYSMFANDPNLHELRQVITVDGKTVKARGKLRETLAMGMKGEADRAKKNMLKEFERYGLKETASVDFGQAILMFARRAQENFQFSELRTEFVGPDRVAVVSYQQKDEGAAAVTVFEGKQVVRHKLQGTVHLRQPDGIPLRLTMDASRQEKEVHLAHKATIDYQLSPHGFVLPVAVTYTETVNGKMTLESRAKYSDFKMFGANSEVKFTFEDPPATPPAPSGKK